MPDKTINEIIRNNIEQLTNETNTSYRKLSESIDASSNYIQKVIEKSYTPTVDKLEAIANYFNVPISYLFTETHSPISEITDYLIELNDGNLEVVLSLVKTMRKIQQKKD